MSVRLVGQDELRVALSCVAWTCAAAVHPVHEVAITVPDREDKDHASLKCLAHDWQTTESLGFSRSGVTVVLQSISQSDSIIEILDMCTLVMLVRPSHPDEAFAAAFVITRPSWL